MAVRRDESQTGPQMLVRRGVADVVATDLHASAPDRPEAHERLHQLVLAVALDAGHSDDLAGPNLEVDVVDGDVMAIFSHQQVVDGEQTLDRLRCMMV